MVTGSVVCNSRGKGGLSLCRCGLTKACCRWGPLSPDLQYLVDLSVRRHAGKRAATQLRRGAKVRAFPEATRIIWRMACRTKHAVYLHWRLKMCTCTEMTTANFGRTVGKPKNHRAGQPFLFRVDLRKPDSKGDAKYIVSAKAESSCQAWTAALQEASSGCM
jgi:hypothetical protein